MSMKLSIENYVLRTAFGDKKAIDMIADAGFDAMDFSFYWATEGSNFLEQDDYLSYAQQVRAWADARGLAITQAHAPFDLKLDDDPDKQAHDLEMIRRSIRCAAAMGASQIIVHNLSTYNPADFFEENLRFFESLSEDCRTANIRVAVENLWSRKDGEIVGGRLSTPEALSEFLDHLDPELFCGCIDIGHSEIVGVPAADFIRQLGTPKLAALHIQDTDLKSDSHTLPRLGRHDWKAIAKALAEVDYQGDFTFEIFRFLKSFPKTALPDALKLAHTVGRSLISDVERAKEYPVSIAEHYSLTSPARLRSFLADFLPRHPGDYPCPSGDTLRLRFTGYHDPADFICPPDSLFRLLSAFPYRETLPSLQNIYSWIPADYAEDEISQTMQQMDKVYAFFSSCELTGKASDPVRQVTDFFVVDGKLITCFPIGQGSASCADLVDLFLSPCEAGFNEFPAADGENGAEPYVSPLLQDCVRLPSGITEIGPRAFFNCCRPIHVCLPASVKTVARHAFYIDPDSAYDYDHRLLFIEHETGEVDFLGAPFNFIAGYPSVAPLVDTTHYFIISPADSLADQFARRNNIDRSDAIDQALLDFLYLTRDFEDSRDDAGDFRELTEVFRKGESAAPYVMRLSEDPRPVAAACARISFAITDRIRNNYFEAKDTMKWLFMYGAEEQLLSFEDLDDYCAGTARAAVELMRAKSSNLEKALLSLDAGSIADFIESLEDQPDYNMGWRNIFFEGRNDDYAVEEFFALGELCARLFVTSHSDKWERILEAAVELCQNLTDDERFGHFSRKEIQSWTDRPVFPDDEEEEEDDE